jgi:hypothetical protein
VENTTRDPPWASSKPYPQILYQAESHAKDKHSGLFVLLNTDKKKKKSFIIMTPGYSCNRRDTS